MKSLSTIILLCALIAFTIATNTTNPHPRFRRKTSVTTTFRFVTTIVCPEITEEWCVQLEYYEYDKASPDDFLGKTKWNCLSEGDTQIVELTASQIGDGVDWFDNKYELCVKGSHNCGTNGDVHLFDIYVAEVPTSLQSAPVRHTINLANV